jgi:hypothetical protein
MRGVLRRILSPVRIGALARGWGAQSMDSKLLKRAENLAAGLLIPSFASMIFNALNHLVEKGKDVPIPLTTYDISLGCVFTIVGVAVSTQEGDKAKLLFLAFIVLLLVLITTNIILVNVLGPRFHWIMIGVGDFLALAVVAWAIWEA